jgi:hypothetical protein
MLRPDMLEWRLDERDRTRQDIASMQHCSNLFTTVDLAGSREFHPCHEIAWKVCSHHKSSGSDHQALKLS